jgi:Spy/CpxP family protein refolding chaperone
LRDARSKIEDEPETGPDSENQNDRPPVQVKPRPKLTRSKVDDDTILRTRLLVLETVQKDLGLTADQKKQILDLVKVSWAQSREFRAKAREALPPSQSRSPEESEARWRELRALNDDFKGKGKELRANVLAVLTPSQSERLSQIQLQTSVPGALARPEISKALGISEEQRGKIDAICERMAETLLADPPALDGLNSYERRKKVIEFSTKRDKVQEEANKLVLDVLTPEQRTKLEKLQGRKVEIAFPYDALVPEEVQTDGQ